jgi:hypothetical protein
MTDLSTYRTELLTRLRAATDDLAWASHALGPIHLAYKPSEAEWSIHEHIAHALDMEQEVILPLLRWATVPDMLVPLDYSRRGWRERRYRPSAPIGDLIGTLQRIREEELLVFLEMSDQAWVRLQTDAQWGPVTPQWVAELAYRHALDHLQQVMALRQDLHLAALQPVGIAGEPRS